MAALFDTATIPSPEHYYDNCKYGSNSSFDTFGLCNRRYELDKLLPRSKSIDQNNPDLRFGHILGSSIQQYFITGNLNAAYLNALQEWTGILDEDDAETQRKKKTFWHILNAANHIVEHRLGRYSGYEVVDFGSGPACELGFSIDFGNGYYYRGYIDIVLVNRARRKLLVLELKSTIAWQPKESSYKWSGQGLGYSLVLDHIARTLGLEAEASWEVHYPVYSTSQYEWHFFEFHKSRLERAKWIKNIIITNSRIAERIADGYFPQHSNGCNAFNRVCDHYGYCDQPNELIMPTGTDQRTDSVYEFNYKIEDIITQMLSERM